MMSPPGAGKTLLARSMPSILPALALEESLEVMSEGYSQW
jgi:predicted ATPase with chaperone activity